MAVWPGSLPQRMLLNPGVNDSPPDTRLETQMDAGPAKVRNRYTAGPRPIRGAVGLTLTQRATLETFFTTTLKNGADRFDWIHPTTGAAATFRFKKSGEGPGIVYRQAEPDYVVAELTLEIVP